MRPYSTLAWVSLESLGLNSYSLPSLRTERGGGGGGGGGTILGLKSLLWLLSQPEPVCLYIECHLVLSKLPSIHWVVILAIVCFQRYP